MSNFNNFLADFSKSGNRYNAALRLVMSGKATGMSAEDIIDRAHAVGVTTHDRDIRRLWNQSKVEPNRRSSSWRPSRRSRPAETPAEPLRQEDRDFVPITLRNYGRTTAFTKTTTADIFGEIIRLPEDQHFDFEDNHKPANPAKIAARHLRALFRPGDLIWAGSFDIGSDGGKYKTAFDGIPLRKGGGIIEAHVLADRIGAGVVRRIPTHITLNPVTGKSVEIPNADGKGTHPSYNCKETIAAYRHALIEFDDLYETDAEGIKTPSQDQIDIAAGICDYSFETEIFRVVSCSSTGGKSIHTVLDVEAQTADEYKKQLAAIADLFTSADDPRFRADLAPFRNHATLFRLAGAIRPETGRRAHLLWSNP